MWRIEAGGEGEGEEEDDDASSVGRPKAKLLPTAKDDVEGSGDCLWEISLIIGPEVTR